MLEYISRQDAIKRNLKTYFVGKACPKGHVAPRKLKNSECLHCIQVYSKTYIKGYYQKNKKRIDANHLLWRSDINNKATIKARNPKYFKYMPHWASFDAIRLFYIEAIKRSKETGEPWEVDHIVPIRGKDVCGLHVETNLRIVRKSENMKKSNKLFQDLINNLYASHTTSATKKAFGS